MPDRLCSAVANPIVCNAQEQRQLALIGDYLDQRGYRKQSHPPGKPLREMEPGTYTFRMNLPVRKTHKVNVPIDVVIQPKRLCKDSLPILIEAKSAGDFTNTNKRRKEEAVKFHQLQVTYGEIVAFVLLIDDDKVIPDMFDIGWSIDIDESGVKIESERVKDAEGVETGYRFLHPIKDLEHDLPMLKPAAFSFDRERTFAWRDFVDDLLDDVLLGASAHTTRS